MTDPDQAGDAPKPLAEAPAERPQKPAQEPFWRTTTLDDMTDAQWESLCDGCGRCCLIKLEDEDTGRIYYTDVGCRLLDGDTCRCRDYPNRQSQVPDCVRLTPQTVRSLSWLPPTCAYRLVREGRDLPWWHPLVSGDQETVVAAGVSVRGRLSGLEQDMEPEELIERIVQWPDRVPRKAKSPQVKSQPTKSPPTKSPPIKGPPAAVAGRIRTGRSGKG